MQVTRVLIKSIVLSIILSLIAISAETLDYPHNNINNIGCDSCHFVYGAQPSLLPPWTDHTPQDIDDTQFNTLCWSCHNDIEAPYLRTHSSLQNDNGYGYWTIECRTCHNPHTQQQVRTFGSASYLYSGNSTDVTATTLTQTGAGWTVDEYEGLVLIPNAGNSTRLKYGYKITGNTGDTITVEGPIDLTKVSAGNTFAVIYGKLVNNIIDLDEIIDASPPKTGLKTTRYFNNSGGNSFADGDGIYDGVCEVCHTQTNHFMNNGGGADQMHTNMGSPAGTDCTVCHKHINGFRGMGGGAHKTHVIEGYGPQLSCADCHGSNTPPTLADGQNLTDTTVCNNCHSAADASTAKSYWDTPGSSEGVVGSWAVMESEADFCGSCHDATPGNTKSDGSGDTAPNVMGDNTTYGFSITGHGKASGNYTRLSWQGAAATGNPAANRLCSSCHDLLSTHFNTIADRLKAGYENDINNSNCKQCHNPGTAAAADPQWYTTYTDYSNSSHGTKKCTDCHNVHGSSGNYPAMTKANQENLCYQCHTQGVVQNNAISGPGLADDIQEAFSLANKHDIGTSFSISSNNYTLECVSCHNVHIVTGKYRDADLDKSPVTLFSNNTAVWGDDFIEKMEYYATPGKYQKPLVTANTYTDANLPDYSTFCLDCHSNAIGSISAKNWDNDPHGKKTAGLSGMITGGGVTGWGYGGPKDCPDWKGCGRAFDWTSDRCSPGGSVDDCWPVIPRGAGTNAFVVGGYSQSERNAGVNYVLSCTDCHEAHGSGNYKMLRLALNRGYDEPDKPLTNYSNQIGSPPVWDDSPSDGSRGLCMQCHNPKNTREHSYNPGWHNNSVCATGPCHQPPTYNHPSFGHDKCYGRCHSSTYVWDTNLLNDPAQWATFHENRRKGNNSQTAEEEPGLVFNYRFENNLKDSNSWNLHGISFNGSVSYVTGKSGNAVVLNDTPIEVGTEEHQWGSTTYDSGGSHGNTSKLTEMKYNTTVEAWVYPTSDPSDGFERKIMAKHNYWSGGYAFVIKPVNGRYRVGFLVNVDLGGPTESWDSEGCNGLRGAYSSVDIPINEWTHVAATFDTAGPDRTSGDPSVGRIRIYVNGNDVTTGDDPDVSTNCWVQPAAGETAITPYTEYMTKWPTCGGGTWCATALSVGGLNWSAPDDNFTGRLDEVKLWYVTKDADYMDAQAGPGILAVESAPGSYNLNVTFSEGAYSEAYQIGALDASDFVLTDTNADNPRTITGVVHTAGESVATLIMSAPSIMADLDADVLAFADAGSAYDEYDNDASTNPATITGPTQCPEGATAFQLNESDAGDYAADEQIRMIGTVGNPTTAFQDGDGYFHGDGIDDSTYIYDENTKACLDEFSAFTYEVRFRPDVIDLDSEELNPGNTLDRTVQTLFERKWTFNLKISRADFWGDNNPPAGRAFIYSWYRPDNSSEGGRAWHQAFTYDDKCYLEAGHWYQFRWVWNSARTGGIPADFYIDDQGTDGFDTGESWAGYISCTRPPDYMDRFRATEGNRLSPVSGKASYPFSIGALVTNKDYAFNGLIDWVSYTPSADYSGLDAPAPVQTVAGDGQVEINWGDVAGATSYNIYWGNSTGVSTASGTKITGVTSPYIHTGRANGIYYYYIVSAMKDVDSVPGDEEVVSSEVKAMPVNSAPVAAPADFAAEGYNKVCLLSWSGAPGATFYNIYWDTTPGVNTASPNVITGATAEYDHLSRTNGTTYYYIVTPVNSYGEGPASSEASCVPNQHPTATATAGDGQVELTWDAVDGATSYNIYWENDRDVKRATAANITGVTSPYTHTGLTNGTKYWYIVTAVHASGETFGPYTVSATPSAP